MKFIVSSAALSLALFACTPASNSGDDDNGDAPLPDATIGAGGGMGGGMAQGGAMGGNSGTGGEPGMGGMMPPPMERPIDDRCPDGQAGNYVLVMYPDRVDAYRRFDFRLEYFCEFLALSDNGITNATGMVLNRDGDQFLVTQPEDDRGAVYSFSANGEFERRVARNVNLAGVDGIWNTFGERFVIWSRTSQNMYELDEDGSFRTRFQPPTIAGSRVENVTDIAFVDQDSFVATFSDRPPQLFKDPFGPEFPAGEIGPANAVVPIQTPEGVKVLMTAQVGGIGNAYGVMLYDPIITGRRPPDLDTIMVSADSGDIVDGIDVLLLETGFMVLDSNLAGTPRITAFNHEGEPQTSSDLDRADNPIMIIEARIFPDF